MILTQVRDYLKQKRQAPLRDMALEFGIDQDALRPIVELWITKGKVVKLPEGSACGGGCNSCEPQTIELYQWIDS